MVVVIIDSGVDGSSVDVAKKKGVLEEVELVLVFDVDEDVLSGVLFASAQQRME